MEGYKKNTDFNPHIHILEGDGPFVTIHVIKTLSGIACLNYVYGKEQKILMEFHSNASASVVAKYVTDCLNKNTLYTLSTNIGTIPEKIDSEAIHVWLTNTLEYMNAVKLARYP
jgi:hypothetical protein